MLHKAHFSCRIPIFRAGEGKKSSKRWKGENLCWCARRLFDHAWSRVKKKRKRGERITGCAVQGMYDRTLLLFFAMFLFFFFFSFCSWVSTPPAALRKCVCPYPVLFWWWFVLTFGQCWRFLSFSFLFFGFARLYQQFPSGWKVVPAALFICLPPFFV